MKYVRIPRFADDLHYASVVDSSPRTLELALDDKTIDFDVFVWYEDRGRGGIIRRYTITGEIVDCYSQEPAGPELLDQIKDRFRRIDEQWERARDANQILSQSAGV